jgi:hypothetical protein
LGFSGGTKTDFSVHFFRTTSRDVVVVCTWQGGCVQLYNRLYQHLLTSLGDVIVRKSDGQPQDVVTFTCPSAPLSEPFCLVCHVLSVSGAGSFACA